MAEILAPAGSFEQLTAACRSGADAVYLGAKSFNARMAADNFADLKEAVAYCHKRSVKVYVALNTLFCENETGKITQTLKEIASSGADAVIVTDLGTALLVKECCPTLPMHASTQMTVHNLSGVKMLEMLGFKRVILSRELSRDEIAEIVKNTSLEVEVFVHGALCMCMSGQCYLSGILGQRSGNRGRCAQPCRLDFKSKDRNYALSLKDLSLIDRLKELEEIGVASFKIEGRMKRPEYVAAAVSACVKALNGEKADTETLRAVFSRSGFTDGYYLAKRDTDMFGIRTKEDVTAAKGVLQSIENTYKLEKGHIPLDMTFTARADEPMLLTVKCGENTFTAKGAIPQPAQRLSAAKDGIAQNLSKLGGTQYITGSIDITLDDGLYIAAADINALRKQAVEGIDEMRGKPAAHKFTPLPPLGGMPIQNGKKIYTMLTYANQYSDEIGKESDLVFIPVDEITKEIFDGLKDKLVGRIPQFLFGNAQNKCYAILKSLMDMGLKKVSVGNLGGIYLAKKLGFEIYGEYTLGIMNRLSLSAYKRLGLKEADLSFEGALANDNMIAPVIPFGLLAYGHLPLMSFRLCPAKGKDGCGTCKGKNKLTDRQGCDFTVICKNRMYSSLLNPMALYMGDRKDEMHADHCTLLFTDENAESCRRLLYTFKRGEGFTGKYTRGLYYKNLL